MLWGSSLAFLIDRQIARCTAVLFVCAGLSLFGLIHSVLPTGGVYLPGSAVLEGSTIPYRWAGAYALFAVIVILLSRTRAFRESAAQPLAQEPAGA
jgi:AGZA family xanthine/uracil permease-like MFS transporter